MQALATLDWENVKIPCTYFWLWYDHIIDIIIHCMFLGFDIIMATHIKDSCFFNCCNFFISHIHCHLWGETSSLAVVSSSIALLCFFSNEENLIRWAFKWILSCVCPKTFFHSFPKIFCLTPSRSLITGCRTVRCSLLRSCSLQS